MRDTLTDSILFWHDLLDYKYLFFSLGIAVVIILKSVQNKGWNMTTVRISGVRIESPFFHWMHFHCLSFPSSPLKFPICYFATVAFRAFTEFTLHRVVFFGCGNCVLSQWCWWESLNELGTSFLKNSSQSWFSWPNKTFWLLGMSNFSKNTLDCWSTAVSPILFFIMYS